jgi:hypothetical protein
MYSTVYEMSVVPAYAFWHCGFFVLLGLGAFRVSLHRDRPGAVLWGVVALLLGGAGLVAVSNGHVGAYWALSHQNFDTIEGTVHVASRQPASGHAPGDMIDVSGRTLEVNYFNAEPGYHTTLAYGGALEEGARVRLAVSNGRILRLERMK